MMTVFNPTTASPAQSDMRTFPDQSATEDFAKRVYAAWCSAGGPRWTIFLSGPLGSGKSTFARAFLRACGVIGAIKSPSYALIETYQVRAPFAESESETGQLLHVDLYRLRDPREVIQMGLHEQIALSQITLLEWPEQGGAWLPLPDMHLRFDYGQLDSERTLQVQLSAQCTESMRALH